MKMIVMEKNGKKLVKSADGTFVPYEYFQNVFNMYNKTINVINKSIQKNEDINAVIDCLINVLSYYSIKKNLNIEKIKQLLDITYKKWVSRQKGN